MNWLRVFEAAARTSSFARAAERLAMSPPAVSQQIKALEGHLGCQLFERTAAGVTLTEAGRSLLVVVTDALGRMEDAAAAVSVSTKPPLVVGVSLTLLSGWLAPRLPDFVSEYPEINLKISSLIGRPEIPPRDAAVWIAFGQPPSETQSTLLFGEHLIPVSHPKIAATINSRGDLLNANLIEVSDHRRNWAQMLELDVIPAQVRITHVDTTLAALSLAQAAFGVALARPPASDELVKAFGLVPCLGNERLAGVEDYYVVTNAAARLDEDARVFKDWVIQQAAKETS